MNRKKQLFAIVAIFVDDSFSFCGSSLSASQPSSIWFLQKCAMDAPSAPVTLCIIELDALHSQTTFHDVKTEVLWLWQKSCNADIEL